MPSRRAVDEIGLGPIYPNYGDPIVNRTAPNVGSLKSQIRADLEKYGLAFTMFWKRGLCSKQLKQIGVCWVWPNNYQNGITLTTPIAISIPHPPHPMPPSPPHGVGWWGMDIAIGVVNVMPFW